VYSEFPFQLERLRSQVMRAKLLLNRTWRPHLPSLAQAVCRRLIGRGTSCARSLGKDFSALAAYRKRQCSNHSAQTALEKDPPYGAQSHV
jgi:hypothetical protein